MSFAKILTKSCVVYSVIFFSVSFFPFLEAEARYPGSKILTDDKAKLPSVADYGPSYLVYNKSFIRRSFYSFIYLLRDSFDYSYRNRIPSLFI